MPRIVPVRRTMTERIFSAIGSNKFFIAVICLLVAQAAWIALSGRYPMAFDEDFHLGIIKLYTHHLSPFWGAQPVGADAYGAVARDPSYLFHYLMSFPYRLISVFTSSQTVTVIILRFIDIGLFAASLPLYRRLFDVLGAPRAITHACLALFVLIPITPLLAAQINYDNLLIPLTALMLLLTAQAGVELRRHKRVAVRRLLEILAIGLFASLVKYAFLPIFLVAVVFLGVCMLGAYPSKREALASLKSGFLNIGQRTRFVLVMLVIVAAVLFVQRYGVNIIRYRTPVADCSAVLSTKECQAYGPWNRDYYLEANKAPDAPSSPFVFSADWFYGMWLRTFFAVDGPATNFQTRGPLIMPSIGAIVFISVGALAALYSFRRILGRYSKPVVWLCVGTMATYVAILWLDNYKSFLGTGQAVAINGRYLLPVLPMLMVICALGLNEILRGHKQIKLTVLALALVCSLWGGGVLTYILRSNNAWYWPNSAVDATNRSVRSTLGPITPGYRSPNEFMGGN